MVVAFAVPFITPSENSGSWGPPSDVLIDKFTDLPYQPFGRSDRLGRAADFSAGGGGNQHRNNNNDRYNNNHRGRGGGFGRNNNNNNNNNERNNEEDEAEKNFQLVDTTKTITTKRFVNPASKRRQQSQRLRQINARRQQNVSGPGLDRMTTGFGRGGGGGGRGGGGGPGGRGRGRGGRHYYNQRADRPPSVAVQPHWQLLEEIDLSKLNKNLTTSTDVPSVEDLFMCGFLDHYNDSYDKVSARQPVALKRSKHKEFYPVTTTDDPALENLALHADDNKDDEDNGTNKNIYITDAILSHLMTCTRSVYPWDVVVHKLQDGTLFFDKRDEGSFDLLTVQETAYAAPTEDEQPAKLAMEATAINQNFSQQILKKGNRRELDLVNPFYDADDNNDNNNSGTNRTEPASIAFRYRKFRLDDRTNVICRTELHGLVKKTQYMTAFALNEYTPSKAINPVNWREKMDSQLGAVLASELKNNSFKIAKWTAQSMLAAADQMKVGFCSRVHPKSAADGHVILATQFYRPHDFATQQGLAESTMWSVFRMFVALLHKQPGGGGKYVIMRNPNKAVIHLYQVALDEFDMHSDDGVSSV